MCENRLLTGKSCLMRSYISQTSFTDKVKNWYYAAITKQFYYMLALCVNCFIPFHWMAREGLAQVRQISKIMHSTLSHAILKMIQFGLVVGHWHWYDWIGLIRQMNNAMSNAVSKTFGLNYFDFSRLFGLSIFSFLRIASHENEYLLIGSRSSVGRSSVWHVLTLEQIELYYRSDRRSIANVRTHRQRDWVSF